MVKRLDQLALLLATVGALNWGLVGLFKFDLVAEIFGEEFGETNAASRTVYTIVGLAGLYLLSFLARTLRDDEALPDRDDGASQLSTAPR